MPKVLYEPVYFTVVVKTRDGKIKRVFRRFVAPHIKEEDVKRYATGFLDGYFSGAGNLLAGIVVRSRKGEELKEVHGIGMLKSDLSLETLDLEEVKL